MPVQYADMRERNFQNLLARDKIRLRDPISGDYLHMSGNGSTHSVTYSWLGFIHQANLLKKRAIENGREWTYQPIHRDDCPDSSAP